jgi:hypothetical protein
MRIHFAGAGIRARRFIEFFDREGSRDCLSVSSEHNAPVTETHIIFIFEPNRADLCTFAAAGAFGWVDVAWFLREFYCKVSGITRNFLNFGQGQQFDVKVPADLDQLGGDDSHGTIVGGEGLIELCHYPAYGWQFFHQIDVVAGVGKIEGRLHAGDSASDYHNGAYNLFTLDVVIHEIYTSVIKISHTGGSRQTLVEQDISELPLLTPRSLSAIPRDNPTSWT